MATRVAGQVSGEGQSAVFREFVWRFVNIVARAVTALGERPDYRTILRHVTNIDGLCLKYAESYFAERPDVLALVDAIERAREEPPPHMAGRPRRLVAFERAMLRGHPGDEVLDGLRSAMRYEKSYFDKLVASLLPLLEKLTTGKAAELLSPDYRDVDDPRPVWDWRRVVNQRLVVYVGLDALSDAPVAAAVGNSMFADLVSYAGERYKHGDTHGLRRRVEAPRHPVVAHMDEFNELMGDEFIPLVNKGGAAGLQVTAYTQTFSDIQAKTRDVAKARQVSGNFNSLVMFRVKDVDTAALLTDQLPTVNVVELTQIAGYTDSSDPRDGRRLQLPARGPDHEFDGDHAGAARRHAAAQGRGVRAARGRRAVEGAPAAAGGRETGTVGGVRRAGGGHGAALPARGVLVGRRGGDGAGGGRWLRRRPGAWTARPRRASGAAAPAARCIACGCRW